MPRPGLPGSTLRMKPGARRQNAAAGCLALGLAPLFERVAGARWRRVSLR